MIQRRMAKRIFTVTQINSYLKRTIESDTLLDGFFIEGEVSNFRPHSSGHLYFSVKDENSSINCVMFNPEITFTFENGLRVTIFAHAGIYERTGTLQLYVQKIEPTGLGALYMAYEQLKIRLYEEGLFDLSRKKPLPSYPRNIIVVTSPTGAVINDIASVTMRRNNSVRLTLAPVLVQGPDAPSQIAHALEIANQQKRVDAIIVARGGGSFEDLQAFNTELVARAVYNSRVPVVSAVGHETDYTIIDLVSDRRAPTPSAAAEMLVPLKDELIAHIEAIYQRSGELLKRKYNDMSLKVDLLGNDLKRTIEDRLIKARDRLLADEKLLNSLWPFKPLEKGYALIHEGENFISSINDIHPEQSLTIKLKDGSFKATVSERENI